MDQKNINLEDLSKMPESEFKHHFREWLERDGVARGLQAKLRKDLIDTFNQTTLGRKMYSQHQKSARILLSPLILALNTLVAEFLYAQNCHFALSVFSTEVPYRNILPDFDNRTTPFRFNQTELYEIFEAISETIQPDLKNSIHEEYLQNTTDPSSPLLYIMFKKIFKKYENLEKITNVQFIKENSQSKPEEEHKKDDIEIKIKQTQEDENEKIIKTQQFQYLNKYLVILSRKVKEMAENLEHVQKSGRSDQNRNRKSLKTRKLEELNRSLDKILESLRNFSLRKKRDRHMSVILSALDKLALQFRNFNTNFQLVCKKIDQEKYKKIPQQRNEDKTYSDWINEMKTTRNGKKFINKIESCIKKCLEREKDKLKEAFDVQFQNEKALIKLKYKQKFLEMDKQVIKEETEGKRVQSIIEEQLIELNKKHQELLEKVAENEERIKITPKAVNIQKEFFQIPIETVQNQNVYDFLNKSEVVEEECKRNEKKESEKPKETYVDIVKSNLKEMASSIVQHERNVDHIIFDAKLRIQELEHESNQLDRSFQDYLERQKRIKNHMEDNFETIWKKYNFEKNMLNKKTESINALRQHQNLRMQKELNVDNLISKIPSTIPKPISKETSSSREVPEIPVFENPFRKLKEDLLSNKTWNEPVVVLDAATDKQGSSLECHENNFIPKVDNQIRNKINRKKDILRSHSFQKISKVHVIIHDDNQSHEKENKENNEENRKIAGTEEDIIEQISSSARSVGSSQLNLKDHILDHIDVSSSKPSSSQSRESNQNKNINCRRTLFTTEIDNEKSKSNEKEKNNSSKIFQISSFSKTSPRLREMFDKNDAELVLGRALASSSEIPESRPEVNLNLPLQSSNPLSSPNSTSSSLKFNISIGKEENGKDNFWN